LLLRPQVEVRIQALLGAAINRLGRWTSLQFDAKLSSQARLKMIGQLW
jgi:hypothetical protein